MPSDILINNDMCLLPDNDCSPTEEILKKAINDTNLSYHYYFNSKHDKRCWLKKWILNIPFFPDKVVSLGDVIIEKRSLGRRTIYKQEINISDLFTKKINISKDHYIFNPKLRYLIFDLDFNSVDNDAINRLPGKNNVKIIKYVHALTKWSEQYKILYSVMLAKIVFKKNIEGKWYLYKDEFGI